MSTQFHDDFIAALAGDKTDGSLTAQPGFAVYRNTVFKGCVDAIVANYPALCHLAGEKWLAAAALAYACQTPPDDPRLMLYGAGFADFIAA
ncbi:HvfC/BufC N-terminal domain-containing protein, partial [Craterilacuibacter sp.]|uniref:HvfC/BufC N-terminal domain-containing protein n=1 Tax=Craterilacuibacter sp. TaxID=2870909 RepID=UPI003F3480FD